MDTTNGRLKRIALSFLASVAGFGISFVLLNVALIVYAERRYSHPGSMTGFWAFFTSLPYAIAIGIAAFFLTYLKLGSKRAHDN